MSLSKKFQIQAHPPESINWSHAETVYAEYQNQHSNDQTLERLAQRGGFGVSEAITLLCQRIEHFERGPSYDDLKRQLSSRPVSQFPGLISHIAGLCASQRPFMDKPAFMRFVEQAFDAGAQKVLADESVKK